MQVAEAVGQALHELGVRRVFGLIGSGNFVATNALVAAGAAWSAARHESNAVMMANAYAQLTREVGVCSVHQGPGLTNAVTGIAEAAKSRVPLLVMAADTAAGAIRSNFRIDQGGLVESVGAVVERLRGPESALADVARAYRRAVVERRPVVLMMPLDVQAAPIGEAELEGDSAAVLPVRPAEDAVAEAAWGLAKARRPLILAGRGGVLAGARASLERLGDVVGALFATSAVANGLFAGSPWSLGISGGFASPVAVELIGEADVVLAVGASLNMWTSRHGAIIDPGATVIQVDVEADALGAHHRVDIGVVGDAGETAKALAAALGRPGRAAAGWRDPELAERIREGAWPLVPYEDAGTLSGIDPRTLSIRLDRLLPDERTVAIDSGHFMGWPARYLRVPDAQGFVFTQGFQSVGLGLGSAIGAAVARPDRLTVACLGDGGLLMSMADLETVARLDLGMLIVVYDDAAYGAEVHHFGPQGHALDLVRFPDADLAALARGAGIRGAVVRRPEDLTVVSDWLSAGARPALLLDAKVVPSLVADWLEEAFQGH